MWTRIGGRTIALDAITEILAGKLDAMPKHVRIPLPSTRSADIDPLRVAAGTPPETATPPGPIAPPSGIPAVTEAESLRGSPRWGMSTPAWMPVSTPAGDPAAIPEQAARGTRLI